LFYFLGAFTKATVTFVMFFCLSACNNSAPTGLIFMIVIFESPPPPRTYHYFYVAAGLVWAQDPKSYAGGSVCYR
jgi:hypothetical protein